MKTKFEEKQLVGEEKEFTMLTEEDMKELMGGERDPYKIEDMDTPL